MATSEAVPFAKTGGLADVTGALPVEVSRLGHPTCVIMPAYRSARYCGLPIEPLGIDFIVPIGSKTVAGRLLRSHLPASEVPVYLVQQDEYFDRDELYADGYEAYSDNCERFVFFCRAVFEAIRLLELEVDVIHANDWQTGLIPAYLALEYRRQARWRHIASLFTIHNMAYQGIFWHWDMLLTGLDWKHFNWREMEFHGQINLLKTGLVFADAINTVSPRYSEEIQTPEFGCGLEGVLRERRDVVCGILNGIDDREWNPETDPMIPAHYHAGTFEEGKAKCKAALQREFGLPELDNVPLLGAVGRLVPQKGFDLVAGVAADWVRWSDAQWVILGTGNTEYVAQFRELCRQFPQKAAARFEFSNRLAHLIEAGADVFLMPSRFEPCGLNQLYSLRYGTPPVVRNTGGLADTVVDASAENLARGTATGFVFQEAVPEALAEAIDRACQAYRDRGVWRQLVQTGMQQDWSWRRSAQQYVQLYERIATEARRRAGG